MLPPLRIMPRDAVPPEKRLSRDSILLLIVHALFQLGSSMAGVFLNLYLWRLTHSLWISGMYSAIAVALSPVGFALAGWAAKKRHPLFPYRLGILLSAGFYLAVVLLQERVVELYPLFAVCSGLVSGCYWIGYLVLTYDVTTETNRLRYLGINTVTFTFAGLVGPVLAGWIISRSGGLAGYVLTFAIAFLTFAGSAAVTYGMQGRRSGHRAYFLRSMPRLIRKRPDWTLSLLGFLVMGLLQGVMLFLPNLLLFQAVGREDSVGYLGVVLSLTAMAAGYGQSRWSKPGMHRLLMLVCAIGVTAGSLLLLGRFGLPTVLGFLVLYNFFSPLQGNVLSSYYYTMINRLPLKGQLKIESIVMREVFLDVGRVLSTLVTIGAASSMTGRTMTYMLLGLALTQFALPLCMEREKRTEPKERPERGLRG